METSAPTAGDNRHSELGLVDPGAGDVAGWARMGASPAQVVIPIVGGAFAGRVKAGLAAGMAP